MHMFLGFLLTLFAMDRVVFTAVLILFTFMIAVAHIIWVVLLITSPLAGIRGIIQS